MLALMILNSQATLMDGESYAKFLLFLAGVGGTGVLLFAGVKANQGQGAYWATRCLLVAGVLNLLLALALQGMVWDETSREESWIGLSILSFLGGIVYLVGMFALCARFGATCKRVKQLEEIASALSAAQAHATAQQEEGKA